MFSRKKKEELMAREEANEIWKSWVDKKDDERKQKRRDKMEENRRKEELERKVVPWCLLRKSFMCQFVNLTLGSG